VRDAPGLHGSGRGLLPIVARERPRGWGLGLGSTLAALTTSRAVGRSRKKTAAHGNNASLASVPEETTDGDIALYLSENQASCSEWRGDGCGGLRRSWALKLKLSCPHCGEDHELAVRDTYLEAAIDDAVERMALSR
jgi:hypothetical protein